MATKKINYEKSLTEVQSIVNELQENEIGIDDMAKKIEKAVSLIQQCRQKLRQTEEKVDDLLE